MQSISFHSIADKTNFHVKGFTLSLTFTMRFTATRKWPITPAKRNNGHTTNQSELEANTCNRRQTRERSMLAAKSLLVSVLIGWERGTNSANESLRRAEQNHTECEIPFDTQWKIALLLMQQLVFLLLLYKTKTQEMHRLTFILKTKTNKPINNSHTRCPHV